jgi:hypothetical protein
MDIEIINKAISLLPSEENMALQYLKDNLLDLENDNLSGNWKSELKGFMKGLHAGGLIDVADLDEFDQYLIEYFRKHSIDSEYDLVKVENCCTY